MAFSNSQTVRCVQHTPTRTRTRTTNHIHTPQTTPTSTPTPTPTPISTSPSPQAKAVALTRFSPHSGLHDARRKCTLCWSCTSCSGPCPRSGRSGGASCKKRWASGCRSPPRPMHRPSSARRARHARGEGVPRSAVAAAAAVMATAAAAAAAAAALGARTVRRCSGHSSRSSGLRAKRRGRTRPPFTSRHPSQSDRQRLGWRDDLMALLLLSSSLGEWGCYPCSDLFFLPNPCDCSPLACL